MRLILKQSSNRPDGIQEIENLVEEEDLVKAICEKKPVVVARIANKLQDSIKL